VATFESVFTSPVAWIADRLEGVAMQPGRRAVVLVAAERQAHAIRRHLCVERAHPEHLAGVLFLRPVELARELLLRAGTVCMPGWEDVRRLRVLHLFETGTLTDQLRYFTAEQLRSGQGYVDAFSRTIADLEGSGLDATLALRVAERLSRQDRAAADRLHDVAVTWQAADAGARTAATTAQVLAAATELVGARPQLVEPFGPLLAMLTSSPSTMVLRFLQALPACRAVFQEARPLRGDTQRWRPLIDLAPAPATARVASTTPDTPARESELTLVQRYLFALPETLTDPERPRSAGPDGSVDLEEYPSVEDEIEAAATWVTEQIAAGTPVEQIALIVPEIDPYGGLLADRLARISAAPNEPAIGAYVAGRVSLAASPAGMRLHGLLNALARGLEAEATIRMIPALRRNRQGNDEGRERLSPSRAAEIVYGAGIVGGSPGDRGGLQEWTPRLLRRRDAMRALASESAPDDALAADEPEKRLDVRARHDAERWLRDVEPILEAITELQQLAQTITKGAPLYVAWPELRGFCDRWLRIPPDPPDLLARLDKSLQPILTDAVARTVSGAAALRVLMDVLRHERRSMARFGEPCVFVGTASQAAGLSFAAVRVLGLAEGALPHTPHDDPIVPDALRKRIEEAARAQQTRPDIVLPRLADRVLDDIHDVFRVVSGAGRGLALSAPRQWVDRSDREVSGIMLEVATALGRSMRHEAEEGDVPTAARLRAAYLNPGRAARQRSAEARPLSPRALLTSAAPASTGAGAPAIAVPAAWTEGAALAVDRIWHLATALEAGALGNVDGVVTDAWPVVQPLGLVPTRPVSASAVALLLGCPHRFLLERILYLSEPAVRPSTDVIAPMAYGSLFHAAAERFFNEAGPALCRHEGSVEEWVARARQIAGEEFDELRYTYPMRGEDGIQRERQRLQRQIEQLVHYEWEAPPREFLASELTFGDPDPVRLPLDTGDLYVRGAIDRIDRIGPAALSVRDLKTGRVRDFGEEPINAGRDLQIGFYVLALEAIGYGAAPVGVAAYVHPSAAQEPDRAFDGANIDILRRQTRDWLGIARRLLSNGAFPRTPNAEDCTYCPFVPACGEGAQLQSAKKLDALPSDHPLEPFVRFKRRRSEDEA